MQSSCSRLVDVQRRGRFYVPLSVIIGGRAKGYRVKDTCREQISRMGEANDIWMRVADNVFRSRNPIGGTFHDCMGETDEMRRLRQNEKDKIQKRSSVISLPSEINYAHILR